MLLTLQQQQELVRKGLAVAKTNGKFITFKYHRKVMYDYLWKKYPELLECRGHTYDVETSELVLAAPTKTFNYLEDGHWSDVPMDTKITAYKKYNGFMGTVSVHDGEYVLGTTGTVNGTHEFGQMFRQKFNEAVTMLASHSSFNTNRKITWLYEVIHENDPHIVYEKPGLVYLGNRVNSTGKFYPAVSERDENDTWYPNMTLGQMLEIIKEVKHEGFMVYDEHGNVCKMKSPYYVGKKKLMRMSQSGVHSMYTKQDKQIEGLPDMWYPMVAEIIYRFDEGHWLSMDAQVRRMYIEQME